MDYIQQAFKGKNDTWMFFLTVFLVSGLFVFNIIFFVFFGADIDVAEVQRKLMELVPSKNFWLAVNLLPFVILLALLFVLVKFLHQRSLLSLTTARKKVDWRRALFSFSLIVLITLISFAVSYYLEPDSIKLQFDPVKFFILLIISLLLFPLQIGLEEYLFRGYLMQYIGVYAKSKWVPLILTSVLFGVMHGANPEVAKLGVITMVFYIGTGLLLGIMTLMDDGLELALGFHFGNNLLAAILVTSSWSALQTDALFIYTSEEATNTILEIIFPVMVVYPIILLIMAKKYGWINWKDRLFGSILVPENESINSIGIHDENATNL
jgi:membrane protease YdiL (CAAX protease family)